VTIFKPRNEIERDPEKAAAKLGHYVDFRGAGTDILGYPRISEGSRLYMYNIALVFPGGKCFR
jgi:hypothetical protein